MQIAIAILIHAAPVLEHSFASSLTLKHLLVAFTECFTTAVFLGFNEKIASGSLPQDA
jgi:hypothetical protein